MADELLATNRFPGDGVTTTFLITFAGGYIDRSHVRAFIEDDASRARLSEITITAGMWIDDTNINLGVFAAVGQNILILRDTPKSGPLVDFVNRSRVTEANLDKIAKQAVFSAAETADATNSATLNSILSISGAVLAAETSAAASALTASGAQGVASAASLASGASADAAALSAAAASAELANSVQLAGDQTVAGVKTFSSSPIVPDATLAGQAASKGQVDTAISSAVATREPADANLVKKNVANVFTATQTPDNDTATVSATGTYTFDGAAQVREITLTNAITVTFGAPTGIVENTMYKFKLKAGDTSARTLAWNAAFKFPAGASPLTSGSTTSGAKDIITFIGGPSNTLEYDGHISDVR